MAREFSIMSLVKLIRPAQWLKNAFVFLPMFFAGKFMEWHFWACSLITFISFCFAASAVYCLNDLKDIEADRLHPEKCKRPLAAGTVTRGSAVILMIALVVCSVLISLIFLPDTGVVWIVVCYLLLNVFYSLRFKRYAIVDVSIVAFGFVLRVIGGGLACALPLSPWIICMTYLIAMLMAFGKRRDDVVKFETSGTVTRKNILNYNLAFLNLAIGMLATVTLVCYLMYCLSPEVIARLGCDYVYLTFIFVLAGLIRYLQCSIVLKKSWSPTRLLMTDKFLQICVICWVASFALILLFFGK